MESRRRIMMANLVPRNGLMREYLLNGNVLDTSIYGLHATNYGAVLNTTYAGFDGINDYIEIPYFDLDLNQSISMKIDFTNVINTPNYFIGGAAQFTGIRYNGTSFLVLPVANTLDLLLLNWTKLAGFVHFYCYKKTSVLYSIYLNGIYIGDSGCNRSEQFRISRIGARDPNTELSFNGKIKLFRAYNRVLTELEILNLANE